MVLSGFSRESNSNIHSRVFRTYKFLASCDLIENRYFNSPQTTECKTCIYNVRQIAPFLLENSNDQTIKQNLCTFLREIIYMEFQELNSTKIYYTFVIDNTHFGILYHKEWEFGILLAFFVQGCKILQTFINLADIWLSTFNGII